MSEQYTGKDVLLRLRDTMHCRSTNELRRDAGNEIEQLRAENSRLTRELDEARATIKAQHDARNVLAGDINMTAVKRAAELEARLAWRKVSEPPADGVEVLTCHAKSGVINACIRLPNKFESLETGDRMDKDVTHWREIGPLPAAPNEAGK